MLLVNKEPEKIKYTIKNRLQETQRMKRNTACPKYEC
jgi:hypothetical protein